MSKKRENGNGGTFLRNNIELIKYDQITVRNV